MKNYNDNSEPFSNEIEEGYLFYNDKLYNGLLKYHTFFYNKNNKNVEVKNEYYSTFLFGSSHGVNIKFYLK